MIRATILQFNSSTQVVHCSCSFMNYSELCRLIIGQFEFNIFELIIFADLLFDQNVYWNLYWNQFFNPLNFNSTKIHRKVPLISFICENGTCRLLTKSMEKARRRKMVWLKICSSWHVFHRIIEFHAWANVSSSFDRRETDLFSREMHKTGNKWFDRARVPYLPFWW